MEKSNASRKSVALDIRASAVDGEAGRRISRGKPGLPVLIILFSHPRGLSGEAFIAF